MAGYSNVLVDGAYIEANDAGIAIKSGILTINDGDVIVTGIDEVPTTLNPNGINRTGTTFQIESNNGYAGDIVIDIKVVILLAKTVMLCTNMEIIQKLAVLI